MGHNPSREVEKCIERIRSPLSSESHIDPSTREPGQDIHVVVDDPDVGKFFKQVREHDLDTDLFRGRQGKLRGWLSL